VELKRHCVEWMRECGSFAYTLKRLRQLDASIRAEIAQLGGNVMLTGLMNKLGETLFSDDAAADGGAGDGAGTGANGGAKRKRET
jgi:hypothetical protein